MASEITDSLHAAVDRLDSARAVLDATAATLEQARTGVSKFTADRDAAEAAHGEAVTALKALIDQA